MNFTSTIFVLFVAIVAFVYYVVPRRMQCLVLLAASYIFYAYASLKAFAYLVPTTIEVFLCALWMQRIANKYADRLSGVTDKSERKRIRSACNAEKKRVLVFSLVVTIGILCVLKYTNFIRLNFAIAASALGYPVHFSAVNFFIPLGLSFYTFSAAGYLFDIYNGKYIAEKSLARFALFMSYFPSIVQGPINRNDALRVELFEKEHEFSLRDSQFAVQRILCGFLKKLVIADRAELVVSSVFDGYQNLPWFSVLFGLFMYSIELYADFAGGMDIALGISELFGVKLPENFRQPYFATSVGDFWRRWHITLGGWMKDYVFYPFCLSKLMTALSKKLAKKSRHLSKVVPACIGNILIFLLVGIWHGAEWHYIFWGLYQGGIIAFSVLMEPVYCKMTAFLHINTKSGAWKAFRILRTFFIILVGYILDEISDLTDVRGMALQLFDFSNFALVSNFHPDMLSVAIVLAFSAVWFVASLYKERTECSVRQKVASFPLVVRWAIYIALILSVPYFEAKYSAGFMYANF